jgi:hypothetical protein
LFAESFNRRGRRARGELNTSAVWRAGSDLLLILNAVNATVERNIDGAEKNRTDSG